MTGSGFAMVFFAVLMLGGLMLLGVVLVRVLGGGIGRRSNGPGEQDPPGPGAEGDR